MALGSSSLFRSSGEQNVGLGISAGYLVAGNKNVSIGPHANYSAVGNYNVALGSNSLRSVTGSNNIEFVTLGPMQALLALMTISYTSKIQSSVTPPANSSP